MQTKRHYFRNFGYWFFFLLGALLLGLLLQTGLNIQNVTPMLFTLAVFCIALTTRSYFWGISASVASALIVNYAFSYPYFDFDFAIPENLSTALVLTAVCAGAGIAGDRDSAVAADSGTALPDREEIKYVALTFDDGPSPRCTPQLLDGLKERGVRATFFVVGCQVVKDPDIVIRMAAEGHQVGNHSYDHKELDKLSCGEAAEDMQRNNDLLCQLLGEGDYWVRPPYGLLSQEEMAALTVPIINWSVDTEDWKSKDAEKILDIIYRDAGDGDIILLHDRYLNSVDAALRAVDHLQQQGYRFVTVAELLALKGVEPEGGEVYRSVS